MLDILLNDRGILQGKVQQRPSPTAFVAHIDREGEALYPIGGRDTFVATVAPTSTWTISTNRILPLSNLSATRNTNPPTCYIFSQQWEREIREKSGYLLDAQIFFCAGKSSQEIVSVFPESLRRLGNKSIGVPRMMRVESSECIKEGFVMSEELRSPAFPHIACSFFVPSIELTQRLIRKFIPKRNVFTSVIPKSDAAFSKKYL